MESPWSIKCRGPGRVAGGGGGGGGRGGRLGEVSRPHGWGWEERVVPVLGDYSNNSLARKGNLKKQVREKSGPEVGRQRWHGRLQVAV